MTKITSTLFNKRRTGGPTKHQKPARGDNKGNNALLLLRRKHWSAAAVEVLGLRDAMPVRRCAIDCVPDSPLPRQVAADSAHLLPHIPPRLLQLLPQEPSFRRLKGIEALWVKRHGAFGHGWRRGGSELLTRAVQKGTATCTHESNV